MPTPNLVISESDSRQLRMLVENALSSNGKDQANWEALAEEIEKAQVVPTTQLPNNVVTMHSRVRIIDVRTGEQRVFELVYPHEANFAENKLSVLAPIGTALLGYPAGTEISWNVPSGIRRLRIEAVKQPSDATHRENVA